FVTSQGSADDAGQEGPLEGADAGLWQKDRNGFNFLAEISIRPSLRFLTTSPSTVIISGVVAKKLHT
ncbi:MAG: hypothetical protein FWE42_00180, partial [Defluviitaleaceae bacterium]|nr:hypothetical protein [Defluviitaleaceae bacterium]